MHAHDSSTDGAAPHRAAPVTLATHRLSPRSARNVRQPGKRPGCTLWRMVLEVATFDISPGDEVKFADAYRRARTLLAGTPGFRSARMTRGVETPTRFVLLVEWDTLEAHETGFRQSPRFAEWRGLIGPFFATPPQVEHYTDVPA